MANFSVKKGDYVVRVSVTEDYIQFEDEMGGWSLSRNLFNKILKKLEASK